MAEQKKGLIKKDVVAPLEDQRRALQEQYDQLSAQPRYQNFKGMQIPISTPTFEMTQLQAQMDELDKKIKAAKEGKNVDGSFIRPEFESLINSETGLLNSEYLLGDKFQQTTLDSAGYDAFRNEALRDPTQSSAWGAMMLENADLNKRRNIDDISAQQNAMTQGAFDQLAAQGGIGSGSREALARSSMRDALMGRQGARRDAQQEALGIRTQDEQNRINQLSQLPGMELQRGNFAADQERQRMGYLGQDVTNALAAMDREREDAMRAWEKNQEVWAANKQADAQRASSGGCFPKDTLVIMEDGSKKAIQDIKVGDKLLVGGKVLSTIIKSQQTPYQLYNYLGVRVTGDHAVFENDKFVWVKDAEHRILTEETTDVVYNLVTENHKIIINNIIFGDHDNADDADLSEEESLRVLNENLYVCRLL